MCTGRCPQCFPRLCPRNPASRRFQSLGLCKALLFQAVVALIVAAVLRQKVGILSNRHQLCHAKSLRPHRSKAPKYRQCRASRLGKGIMVWGRYLVLEIWVWTTGGCPCSDSTCSLASVGFMLLAKACLGACEFATTSPLTCARSLLPGATNSPR